MTVLYWYVLVGLPLILLGGAYGAVRLALKSADRERI